MKIAKILPELKLFFGKFKKNFSKRQFYYFEMYVYSLIVLFSEEKSVCGISKAQVKEACRSSLQRFLSEWKWEFEQVLETARKQLIRELSHVRKKKRKLTLVIDDTTLLKFGKHIFGVGWYKKHKKDNIFRGLQVVVLGVLYDGFLIPLDFRIYVKEKDCAAIHLKFETKLNQARSMLRNLSIPRGFRVEVLADSWYLHQLVTKTCESRGWKWLIRIRANRKIKWEDTGIEEKLTQWVQQIFWNKLYYETQRKNRAVVGHQRIGILKGIERVKIIVTSLKETGDEKWAFWATNNTRTPMVSAIKRFESRWKIEVFFKEARKCFGLENWLFRDVVSIVHHLCLAIVAAMACAWIRMKGFLETQKCKSWGEIVQQIRKKNGRATFLHFIKLYERKKERDFNKLCSHVGF